MRNSLSVLVFASTVWLLICQARSRDYTFDVTGVVTAGAGAPLQDAEVILEVNGPVYDAVAPVKTARRLTNSYGGFVFVYISHKRGVMYTVTIRKDGFEPQTVSGSAPPPGHHTIRFKRTL